MKSQNGLLLRDNAVRRQKQLQYLTFIDNILKKKTLTKHEKASVSLICDISTVPAQSNCLVFHWESLTWLCLAWSGPAEGSSSSQWVWAGEAAETEFWCRERRKADWVRLVDEQDDCRFTSYTTRLNFIPWSLGLDNEWIKEKYERQSNWTFHQLSQPSTITISFQYAHIQCLCVTIFNVFNSIHWKCILVIRQCNVSVFHSFTCDLTVSYLFSHTLLWTNFLYRFYKVFCFLQCFSVACSLEGPHRTTWTTLCVISAGVGVPTLTPLS